MLVDFWKYTISKNLLCVPSQLKYLYGPLLNISAQIFLITTSLCALCLLKNLFAYFATLLCAFA